MILIGRGGWTCCESMISITCICNASSTTYVSCSGVCFEVHGVDVCDGGGADSESGSGSGNVHGGSEGSCGGESDGGGGGRTRDGGWAPI